MRRIVHTAATVAWAFFIAASPLSAVAGNHEADCFRKEKPAETPPKKCGKKKKDNEKDETVCDCEKRQALNKKAAGAHKGVFYANDFSYLNDPCWYCFDDRYLGDSLKQLRPNCWTTLDLGGQYRARYKDENNLRGLGLTGRDDTFLLHRTRVYGNLKVGENFRFYVEYLDAESNYENLPPRPIEVNRSDSLNAFAEVLLWKPCCGGKLSARVGRQELLYGTQRLVSPLDWGNTRRTFDGAKLIWQDDEWDFDIFATRPVFPDARNFDNPDNSQHFVGAFASYKKLEHGKLDVYYLRYAEDDGPTDFDFNTYGLRIQGSREWLLWDFEGAYQFGEFGAATVSAGFFTVGLGAAPKCLPWKPELWIYYDWASGDPVQGAGFHHFFPLAHKYLGFMDLFGRRNLEDLNVLATVHPTEKLTFLAWFHLFNLQRGDDIPYNVAMRPAPAPGFAVVPGGSQHLGEELNLLLTWQMTARMNLALGYSHFWTGDWFRTNPTPGLFQGDADFFYSQYQVNF